MNIFPPLPPLEGLHPIVVHFPIALALVAPALVIVAILARRHRAAWLAAAALILGLGVAGAFAATFTGEATEEAVTIPDAAQAVLHDHEETAELARNLLLGVWAVLVVALAVVWRGGERTKRAVGFALVLWLGLWGGSAVVLANAAHEGGRLVHEFGVRAPLAAVVTPAAPAPAPAEEAHEAEHD